MPINLGAEKDRDIETIMRHDLHKIVKQILTKLPEWQVSHIRQHFEPSWKDGIHQSLFDLWYCQDDTESPARQWFKYMGTQQKDYPEQGWSPADSGIVSLYKCQVCGRLIDDDDIFLNHFRNNNCSGFNDLVEESISYDEFWKKFNNLKVSK